MKAVAELLAGLVPFTPALAGFTVPVVYMVSRRRFVVFAYSVLALAITLLFSLFVAITVFETGNVVVFRAAGWPAPVGIIYVVDMFSAIIAVVTSLVALMIALYSMDYITDTGYPWYNVLLLGAVSGLLGVAYTGDMFNLFVMLEVTAISSYALVMYYMNRADSIVSGLKYAFIGALGTTLYLLAMGVVYSVFGTLNFVDFSIRIRLVDNATLAPVAYGLIMLISFWAFSIKSGVFPNHFWLPDAHPAAPTPISALLSGLVVNTGVLGLYKFFFIASWSSPAYPLPPGMETAKFFVSLISIATGTVSAFIGGLLMFVQTDVKRLIAYSTVMNLGYLFMAAGCLTTRGLSALAFYMVTHSIAKATLFLSAGALIKVAGTRSIDKLSGLGVRFRLAGLALAISTLTLAGLPPLPGFLAKLLLYEALFEYNIGFAIAMVIASAVGLISYMKLLYVVLFGIPVTKPREEHLPVIRAVLTILTLTLITTGIVFLSEPRLLELVFGEAARQVTVGITEYVEQVRIHILQLG